MESANYPKSVSENAFNLRLNERQRERKIEGGKRSRDIRIGEKFMVGHRCDRIAFTRREKKEKAFEIEPTATLSKHRYNTIKIGISSNIDAFVI